MRSLGIRTLIDLRSAKERRKAVSGWPGVRFVWLPMPFDEITHERLKPLLWHRHAYHAVVEMVDRVYADTVEHSCPQLAALFTLMQEPTVYPLLLHCRAGRDRTGFVAAVIQLSLGVSTEAIIEEYLRSNAYLLPQARHAVLVLRLISLGLFPVENLRAVFMSQARYIHTIIGKIECEYGGIVGYLEKCGIDARKLATLRELLVV